MGQAAPGGYLRHTKRAHRAEFVQNLIAEHQDLGAQINRTEKEFRAELGTAYGSMPAQGTRRSES